MKFIFNKKLARSTGKSYFPIGDTQKIGLWNDQCSHGINLTARQWMQAGRLYVESKNILAKRGFP